MPNIKNQRPQSAQSLLREKSILRFLEEFAPSPHHDLLTDVLVTATRLAKDQAGRGELKIIRTALKEMRYAFKVFAPYHEIPKVTVFGSARTRPEWSASSTSRLYIAVALRTACCQ